MERQPTVKVVGTGRRGNTQDTSYTRSPTNTTFLSMGVCLYFLVLLRVSVYVPQERCLPRQRKLETRQTTSLIFPHFKSHILGYPFEKTGRGVPKNTEGAGRVGGILEIDSPMDR